MNNEIYSFLDNGTVTSPKGFAAAGIFCGIKKKKKDLALIYSSLPCTAAGTFTINKVKAAPLLVSQELINKGNKIKAVLVNSGNANACTGEEGLSNAHKAQAYCAEKLGISPEEVLVSSTGVIGQQMPMETYLNGIGQICPTLSENGGLDAAEAIMTTDTKLKSYAVKVSTSQGNITIGGICKGSGMIMPNMATMLAFLTTDAAIPNQLIKKILVKTVNKTFNKISVDGDTSTNDMLILLANGAAGVEISEGSSDEAAFSQALYEVCKKMAKSIVSDGEGATKLVTINVTGAATQEEADIVAKTVANSSLVKTALNGNDANWGRIMSAAGMSGAEIDPSKMTISFNNLLIVGQNYDIVLDEEKALEILKKDEYEINICLNNGSMSTTYWTCDFSIDYVKINANYRT
jgi:glutamate N-acetyltransferase/amino-acid N-acetyltransferase